jgi:large subunit ribosomal protein L22
MATKLETEAVAVAKARFLRIPPRKARYVADMIRGMTVREAIDLLMVTPKPSAIPAILRLLKSAVSNVDRKAHSDTDNLVISEIFVNAGPTLKRIQPRAMGRAFRIRKRTCHITIILGEK